MTKENASEWNGFVLEKDGKIYCMLKKDEETYCIVLKAEGNDEVKEGHFRADCQGKYKINGRTCQPANTPRSPDAPGPWRGSYCGDLETHVRGHEKEGWVISPLESFECLCT